jgi:hypothetical protein
LSKGFVVLCWRRCDTKEAAVAVGALESNMHDAEHLDYGFRKETNTTMLVHRGKRDLRE